MSECTACFRGRESTAVSGWCVYKAKRWPQGDQGSGLHLQGSGWHLKAFNTIGEDVKMIHLL